LEEFSTKIQELDPDIDKENKTYDIAKFWKFLSTKNLKQPLVFPPCVHAYIFKDAINELDTNHHNTKL